MAPADAFEAVLTRFLGSAISDDPCQVIEEAEAITHAMHGLEARLTHLGYAWIHQNPPAVADDEVKGAEDVSVRAGGQGAPQYRGGAAELFALARGSSAFWAEKLLARAGEALARFPLTWAQVQIRKIPLWKMWQLVDQTQKLSAEAAAHLDQELAPLFEAASMNQVKRAIVATQIAIDPQAAQAQAQAARRERGICFDMRGTTAGTCKIYAAVDLPDGQALQSQLAAASEQIKLREQLEDDSAAMAQAFAMLCRGELQFTIDGELVEPTLTVPRTINLNVHFSRDQLETGADGQVTADGIARVEELDSPVLLQQITQWCQLPGTQIKLRPVLDLATRYEIFSYTPTPQLREQIIQRNQTCVFPTCNAKARNCDLDHIKAHATGGCTCTENLAPLCRRHHRMKTRRQWEYEETDDGYLWQFFQVVRKRRKAIQVRKKSATTTKPAWWFSPEFIQNKGAGLILTNRRTPSRNDGPGRKNGPSGNDGSGSEDPPPY